MAASTASVPNLRCKAPPIGRCNTLPRFSQRRTAFKVIDRSDCKAQRSWHTAQPKPVFGRPTHGWSNRPGCGGARQTVIMWFRNDLRLDDNEALVQANKEGSSVLPVYCFDPRDYGKSPAGFDKTGAYRASFLLDCVSDLRQHLKQLGSELVVRMGKPEQVLADLAERVGAKAVYCQTEVTYEEVAVEKAVKLALEGKSAALHSVWGSTLHHINDLPFQLEKMPTSYAEFREAMCDTRIRPAVEPPAQLKGWPAGCNISSGELPSLKKLGVSEEGSANRAFDMHSPAAAMKGGEKQAMRQLSSLVADVVGSQAAAASGCVSPSTSGHSSCKVSPWLAMGALSPRRMYAHLEKHCCSSTASQEGLPDKPGARTSRMSWLQFELLWRDFFRFITRKYSCIPSTSLGQQPTVQQPAMAMT